LAPSGFLLVAMVYTKNKMATKIKKKKENFTVISNNAGAKALSKIQTH